MLEADPRFSNVETPGQKVVSCIFAGQTEFLDMVKQNRALAQRVFFSHIIQPLTEAEVDDYITHRLKVAGTEEAIFTPAAGAGGFPVIRRKPPLINILCDQALLSGYALDKKKIGAELITESTENTLIPLNTQKEPAAAAQKGDPAKQSTSSEPTAETTTGALSNYAGENGQKSSRPQNSILGSDRTHRRSGVGRLFLSETTDFVRLHEFPNGSGQAQRSGQPAEPASASEIGRLQGQVLEMEDRKTTPRRD